MTTLSNNILSVEISNLGAEITSLLHNGRQYIWQADPAYWKRHAPILFPIVGKLIDNTFIHNGEQYHLPQHGFARDSDFESIELRNDTASFRLRPTPDTLKNFPFDFELTARYTLDNNTLHCHWSVTNPGTADLHFQIGAHPAFLYPLFQTQSQNRGYLQLINSNAPLSQISLSTLSADGYILPTQQQITLENGCLPLQEHTFDKGAFVLENSQVQRAILIDCDKNPILDISFDDAPVLGIWSPSKPFCPFVCIEPWHGRCDPITCIATPLSFAERDWTEHLAPKQSFHFDYSITIY